MGWLKREAPSQRDADGSGGRLAVAKHQGVRHARGDNQAPRFISR
jgi:hypothetical protein